MGGIIMGLTKYTWYRFWGQSVLNSILQDTVCNCARNGPLGDNGSGGVAVPKSGWHLTTQPSLFSAVLSQEWHAFFDVEAN